MINREEILELAAQLSLRPQIVEKDYVLGWVLAGIYAHEDLRVSWIFKGGTCLKKCYFDTYRFSEDLDVTVVNRGRLNATTLTNVFREISEWVYERSGIEIPQETIRFDVYENPRGRMSCNGRIYYRGPIAPGGNLPRIKLDLTEDEVLVMTPQKRSVLHPYSDAGEVAFAANCYAYAEIFGEKIRALAERTRPRDLYDVVNLFRRHESQEAAPQVFFVLSRKCEFKDIPVPTQAQLEPNQEEVQADWEQMLAHQLPVLPPFNSFWAVLREFFEWLIGETTRPVPDAVQFPADSQSVTGDLRFLGFSSGPTRVLETIRFAASNRLCVDLDYMTPQGRRSSRLIEPYSLRRTLEGQVLLYAVRVDSGKLRSYRVDRIQGAKVGNQSFTARHKVEFTPSGPFEISGTSPFQGGAGTQAIPRRLRRFSQRRLIVDGPIYVYECTRCGKRFRRKTQNQRSRPHKAPDGWPCPSRTSFFVDTLY